MRQLRVLPSVAAALDLLLGLPTLVVLATQIVAPVVECVSRLEGALVGGALSLHDLVEGARLRRPKLLLLVLHTYRQVRYAKACCTVFRALCINILGLIPGINICTPPLAISIS